MLQIRDIEDSSIQKALGRSFEPKIENLSLESKEKLGKIIHNNSYWRDIKYSHSLTPKLLDEETIKTFLSYKEYFLEQFSEDLDVVAICDNFNPNASFFSSIKFNQNTISKNDFDQRVTLARELNAYLLKLIIILESADESEEIKKANVKNHLLIFPGNPNEVDFICLDGTRQRISNANLETEEMTLIEKVVTEAINEETSKSLSNIYSGNEIHLKPCLIDCLSLDTDLASKIDSNYSLCHSNLRLKSKIDFVIKFKENIFTKINERIDYVTSVYESLLQKEKLELKDIKEFINSLQLSCGVKINQTDLLNDFFSSEDSLFGELNSEMLKTKEQFSKFLEEKLIKIFQSSQTSQDASLSYYEYIKNLDLFDKDGLINSKKINNLLELFNSRNFNSLEDATIQQNKIIAGLLILKDIIVTSEDYNKFYYFDLFNKINSAILVYKKHLDQFGNSELNSHINKLLGSINKKYPEDLQNYKKKLTEHFDESSPEYQESEVSYCDHIFQLSIKQNEQTLRNELSQIDNIYYEKLLNLFLYFGQKKPAQIMIHENDLLSHPAIRNLIFQKILDATFYNNVSEIRNLLGSMSQEDKKVFILYLQKNPSYLRNIELNPSIINLLIENKFDKKILIEILFLNEYPDKKTIEAIVDSIGDKMEKYRFIKSIDKLLDYLIYSGYPIKSLIEIGFTREVLIIKALEYKKTNVVITILNSIADKQEKLKLIFFCKNHERLGAKMAENLVDGNCHDLIKDIINSSLLDDRNIIFLYEIIARSIKKNKPEILRTILSLNNSDVNYFFDNQSNLIRKEILNESSSNQVYQLLIKHGVKFDIEDLIAKFVHEKEEIFKTIFDALDIELKKYFLQNVDLTIGGNLKYFIQCNLLNDILIISTDPDSQDKYDLILPEIFLLFKRAYENDDHRTLEIILNSNILQREENFINHIVDKLLNIDAGENYDFKKDELLLNFIIKAYPELQNVVIDQYVENEKYLPLVKFLLEKNPRLELKNPDKILQYLVRKDDFKLIKEILSSNKNLEINLEIKRELLRSLILKENNSFIYFLLQRQEFIDFIKNSDLKIELLIIATKKEDVNLLEDLLKKLRIDFQTPESRLILSQLLDYSLMNNHKKIANHLIKKYLSSEELSIKLEKNNQLLKEIFIDAIKNGEYGYDLIKKFLSSDFDVNFVDERDFLPIHHFLIYSNQDSDDHLEILTKLIAKTANINHPSKEGITALDIALHGNYFKTTCLLLDCDRIRLNYENIKSLNRFIDEFSFEEKNILIRKINERFYNALEKDQIDEALNLIKNFNFIKTIEGTFSGNKITSLNKIAIRAVDEGDLDTIKKLQEFKFDLSNVVDYRRLSLVHIATIKNNLEMLKILIEDAKISPNSTNTKGETILHRACYLGHNEIVKYLLEKKCNIDAKTSEGKTPYDYAIEGGRSEIVKLLKNYISSESEKNPSDLTLRTNSAPRNRTIYNRPDTPASHSNIKVKGKTGSLETDIFKEIYQCIFRNQMSLKIKVLRLIHYINSSNQEYKILPIQMLIEQNKIEIFKELIRHEAFPVDIEFINKIKSIAKINGKKNFEGELLNFERELDSKKSKPNTTTTTRMPKSNEKAGMSRKLQDVIHQARGMRI
jgi:ankyrin repeat protein